MTDQLAQKFFLRDDCAFDGLDLCLYDTVHRWRGLGNSGTWAKTFVQSSFAVEVLLDDATLALDVSASLLDQVPRVVLRPDHSAGCQQRHRRQAAEGESPRDPLRAKNG